RLDCTPGCGDLRTCPYWGAGRPEYRRAGGVNYFADTLLFGVSYSYQVPFGRFLYAAGRSTGEWEVSGIRRFSDRVSAASNEPSSSDSASRRRVQLGINVYCSERQSRSRTCPD